MPSTDRLQEFTEIVASGSISGAARALGLPRATLSRRLSALEAELSVRLLHRGTRRLVLTPAGEELYRRACRIVADVEEAWATVRRLDDIPRGLLRVSVSGVSWSKLFIDFLQEYPEVQLEVRATTRHVDLVAEGVDVAVRFGEVKDPNLIVRRLFTDRLIVVGSPAYLELRGRPRRAADLSQHDCIVGFAGEWAPSHTWPLRAGGTVRVGGRLAGNHIGLMRAAARGDLGLALLPSGVIASDLDTGGLVAVLEDTVGADTPVNIVYTDREYIEPKVRAFVDRAVQVLPATLSAPYPEL